MYRSTLSYIYVAHYMQANDILAAQSAGPVPAETLIKKEKQALKREAFLHSQSPLLRTSLDSTDLFQ